MIRIAENRGAPLSDAERRATSERSQSGQPQWADVSRFAGARAAFAVERVGAEGRIVGVDPPPPRIEVAKQRGDPRLEFCIGQAQDLSQFPDAAFDAAYMNSVLNWIDDRPKA